jgi:hypothetical protein
MRSDMFLFRLLWQLLPEVLKARNHIAILAFSNGYPQEFSQSDDLVYSSVRRQFIRIC